MNLMCAFIKRKFPAEDWCTMVVAKENNIENIDEEVNNTESCDNVERQLHSSSYAKATDGHVNLSVPQEHMIAKQVITASTTKRLKASHWSTEPTMVGENETDKVHSFEQAIDGNTNGFANNLASPGANLHSTSNYVQQSSNICCTNAKDHHENQPIPYERTFAKQSSMEINIKRSKLVQKNLELSQNGNNKGHIQQTDNDIIDTFVSELEDFSSGAHAIPNNIYVVPSYARSIQLELNQVMPLLF
ncbi:uncharacterized protein LOC107304169 isoform X2 [Oryza brachyantha]|uniref:uncharacterized protein LOC107304169 isoform X2 n=1 Tax=Oryza brachyantha TaxID=4533 RepID=UPI001ADC7EAB|nr:uncharacterized protein LOC107304169 isoform X2 [Oryza brachyantha]